MRIAYYCQHVLGIGHYHRSLEICKSLAAAGHEVTMIVGGPNIAGDNTDAVTFFRLVPLKMNETFHDLQPCDQGLDLDQVKDFRRKSLLEFVESYRPDCLIIELYPFGRKAFRFELEPLLEMIASNGSRCSVFCSLRDILVEKAEGLEKFEKRAVTTLNRYFNGLLIHADPKLIRLEQTFGMTGEIEVPIHYTGFITPMPSAGCRALIRRDLFGEQKQRLIVASIGGGNVGEELLLAAVNAVKILTTKGRPYHLQVFTGPYCDTSTSSKLRGLQNPHLTVQTFTDCFVDWLAAADLSISMAGYNTCMNTVAAGVPALMYPFSQNREQRLRMTILWPDETSVIELARADLQADRLSSLIDHLIEKGHRSGEVDVNGAAATVDIIEHGCR